MLRITITTHASMTRIALEGRLVGAWVHPLKTCWLHEVEKREPGSIRIDLADVVFIDAAGKQLLRSFHEQGARLTARDPWMRAALEEIMQPQA